MFLHHVIITVIQLVKILLTYKAFIIPPFYIMSFDKMISESYEAGERVHIEAERAVNEGIVVVSRLDHVTKHLLLSSWGEPTVEWTDKITIHYVVFLRKLIVALSQV